MKTRRQGIMRSTSSNSDKTWRKRQKEFKPLKLANSRYKQKYKKQHTHMYWVCDRVKFPCSSPYSESKTTTHGELPLQPTKIHSTFTKKLHLTTP